MNIGIRLGWCLVAVAVVMGAPGGARGELSDTGTGMTLRNVADMQLAPVPGFPTCAPAAVQAGDPAQGSSIIYGELETGCVVPWHWHTPNEHLMIVSGTARAEMKGAAPLVLEAGGFAMMPSHHVHQFTCTTACSLYVYSDAAFDMHYVDGGGNEITPDRALSAVGETAVQVPR
jgi:quercetin dioxygenase-like cupin family protein